MAKVYKSAAWNQMILELFQAVRYDLDLGNAVPIATAYKTWWLKSPDAIRMKGKSDIQAYIGGEWVAVVDNTLERWAKEQHLDGPHALYMELSGIPVSKYEFKTSDPKVLEAEVAKKLKKFGFYKCLDWKQLKRGTIRVKYCSKMLNGAVIWFGMSATGRYPWAEFLGKKSYLPNTVFSGWMWRDIVNRVAKYIKYWRPGAATVKKIWDRAGGVISRGSSLSGVPVSSPAEKTAARKILAIIPKLIKETRIGGELVDQGMAKEITQQIFDRKYKASETRRLKHRNEVRKILLQIGMKELSVDMFITRLNDEQSLWFVRQDLLTVLGK